MGDKLFEKISKLEEKTTKSQMDEALLKCEEAIEGIFAGLPVDTNNLMEVIYNEIMEELETNDIDWEE